MADSDGPGDGARWRVFLSHTSELREYPRDGSYLAQVERAVAAAGHVAVDMADFPAADQVPAEFCQERVRGCDVYVGIFGTRYGSPVRDRPEVSYTELEFETATEAGLPRLVFLLDTSAENPGIPVSALIDRKYGTRQDDFCRRSPNCCPLSRPGNTRRERRRRCCSRWRRSGLTMTPGVRAGDGPALGAVGDRGAPFAGLCRGPGLGIQDQQSAGLAPEVADRTLARLAGVSLLTFSLDGSTVTAHRLVMRVIRDNLAAAGSLSAVCEAAALLLDRQAAALSKTWHEERSAVRDLIEQITALDESSAARPSEGDLSRRMTRLRWWAVWFLNELGDSAAQAIAISERLVAGQERVLGPDHPHTLTSRNNLAAAYRATGRTRGSE